MMTLTALMRMTALTTILAAGVASAATAQITGADPHRPNTTLAQATPGQAPSVQPAQPSAPPAQPGMMHPGMMGQGMMRSGMTGEMPMMMGPRRHMMKVMFAVADTNGDGALSFEEVMAVHKRIFDRIDANKDGKVTLEEIQTFMRE